MYKLQISYRYFTFLDNFIFSCKHYVTTDILIPRELHPCVVC
jgi:hypothetical protein